MPFEFKLPDVGEGLHEGTLVEWLVAVGDAVTLDQPFCRLETDKAVVELPAPRPAVVQQLHFEPGDIVEVGQVMITFAEPGDVAAGAPSGSGNSGDGASARPRVSQPLAQALRAVDRPHPGEAQSGAGKDAPRPLATPHTRALARELGVDLAAVNGSGRGGRITDEDVQRAASHQPSGDGARPAPTQSLEAVAPHSRTRPEPTQALPAFDTRATDRYDPQPDTRATGRFDPQPDTRPGHAATRDKGDGRRRTITQQLTTVERRPGAGAARAPSTALAPLARQDSYGAGEEPEERIALTHLRRVIAEAMVASKHTSAHVTHFDEADVTELLSWQRRARDRLVQNGGPRLTLLPYFIKAVASTLRDHPLLNASYDEARQEIVIKRYVHVGVAVDTDEGLIVPVLRHADKKDILTIARELDSLAARARERRLTPAELRGGTFTVSSIGPLGGAFATPIIHQPELAIVGLHAIKQRPAVVDGAIVAREQMFISCSYDHRIIDGMVAARFMHDLIELVENPDMLMLKL